MAARSPVKTIVKLSQDDSEDKVDQVKDFAATASVFSTAKEKNIMLSIDKYKMKEAGFMKNLQDLVFIQKVKEFKKIVM